MASATNWQNLKVANRRRKENEKTKRRNMEKMKLSEINLSLEFISMCFFIIGICTLVGFVSGQYLFYMELSIFGIISFVVLDLFQIILVKEFTKDKQGGGEEK